MPDGCQMVPDECLLPIVHRLHLGLLPIVHLLVLDIKACQRYFK